MNHLSARVWFTASLMILGWMATTWVRSGYTSEVRPLGKDLDLLPVQIDGFQGESIPMDDEVAKILNADAVLNRFYTRANGDSISLHVSAWIQPESLSYVAPHLPRVCYTNSGWKILEERTVSITTATGKLPYLAMLVERNSERHVVIFWYQMGRNVYTSEAEAKNIHREFWGKKSWPPTVKVMLDTPAQDMESAIARLNAFAPSVFAWTNDL